MARSGRTVVSGPKEPWSLSLDYDAVVLTEDCWHCHGTNTAPGDGRTRCGFCAPTPDEVRRANNRLPKPKGYDVT